jgi:hypothetical protein
MLTDEERHYYETRCEACEGMWSERVYRWRHGARDPGMDAAAVAGDYGNPQDYDPASGGKH